MGSRSSSLHINCIVHTFICTHKVRSWKLPYTLLWQRLILLAARRLGKQRLFKPGASQGCADICSSQLPFARSRKSGQVVIISGKYKSCSGEVLAVRASKGKVKLRRSCKNLSFDSVGAIQHYAPFWLALRNWKVHVRSM